MASQIITRGKLCKYQSGNVERFYIQSAIDPSIVVYLDRTSLDRYLGETLTISLEEKEKEPSFTHKLAVALAGA